MTESLLTFFLSLVPRWFTNLSIVSPCCVLCVIRARMFSAHVRGV